MKLINQSAEYLPQGSGIEGIYKQIELAGRTSYLSWDKMTYDSAKKFVDMLIKSKHTSVLEHGTVYLRLPLEYKGYYTQKGNDEIWNSELATPKHYLNPYSTVNTVIENTYLTTIGGGKYLYSKGYYITTNLRVLQENGWLDDLQFLCEPTEFHEKRLSVKVITDIGVTREFNRHRTFSIVEQSTRYCNFSKDKFNNEITFIIPYWLDIHPGEYQMGIKKDGQIEDCYNGDYVWINITTKETLFPLFAKYSDMFLNTMWNVERMYMEFIKKIDGVKEITPQQARIVLPLSTKTEVVYTAFESDWREWFAQRLFGKTGEPHPQIKQLAELIKQEFEKAGVWEGIMKYPSKYE